jgi:hypothetical protein
MCCLKWRLVSYLGVDRRKFFTLTDQDQNANRNPKW